MKLPYMDKEKKKFQDINYYKQIENVLQRPQQCDKVN
jgi:hypothetical protein